MMMVWSRFAYGIGSKTGTHGPSGGPQRGIQGAMTPWWATGGYLGGHDPLVGHRGYLGEQCPDQPLFLSGL